MMELIKKTANWVSPIKTFITTVTEVHNSYMCFDDTQVATLITAIAIMK